MDMIFEVERSDDLERNVRVPLFLCFIDLQQAYDSIDRCGESFSKVPCSRMSLNGTAMSFFIDQRRYAIRHYRPELQGTLVLCQPQSVHSEIVSGQLIVSSPNDGMIPRRREIRHCAEY